MASMWSPWRGCHKCSDGWLQEWTFCSFAHIKKMAQTPNLLYLRKDKMRLENEYNRYFNGIFEFEKEM